MSYNCKHGIEAAFHCFDCEYAFKRTGRLHDEFKTWEFSWSNIHGRSPCAEDGWLADKYRLDARNEIATLRKHDPCPDCLALAKWMRDMSSTGSPYHQGINAFIKEREP